LHAQAVLRAADNPQVVWTVTDGRAYQKFVVADELAPEGVIIKSGLAAGDTVIVAGMQKVSNGTEVEIVNK
ncbi:MAG: efflux RND transporter periplasmic adaptor subunit, partial [Muribaculaceae bacterium]|nr:efflux RND transporter periplasmic adaptor subunit [Muribaculaceae bacterium]